MSQQKTVTPRPLPPALIWAGSAVIAFHFFAILMLVLAAQSGPWATVHFGDTPAEGPMFAGKINATLAPVYLQPLRMNHNYHFMSNRVAMPEIFFEARLKDEQGNVTTLKFPDPGANWWIRHRQGLLAMGLGDDMPVQTPRSEVIPAPGQKMRTVMVWAPVQGDSNLRLQTMEEHLVPKDRPVFRPSPWALLLAHSYSRYLCRAHGAASVELIRHSKDQVIPAILFLDEDKIPPDTYNELVCSFGEYRRED
jgi:hypothetical protein